MTAPTPHRPTCRCGGTGLVDAPPATSTADRSPNPRPYRQLVGCPGHPWPTLPPTLREATDTGHRGIAAARAALEASS